MFPAVRLLACLAILAPRADASPDAAKELARLAERPPAEQCAGLETLLDMRELDEESRRAALTRIRDLAQTAAAPLTDSEKQLVEELKALGPGVVEPLVSRYAIVLGSATFVANARANLVPGLLDATYIVQRQLFAVDPVAIVGHRYVLYPDRSKSSGWSIHGRNLAVAYGRASAEQGTYDELMAHELSHAFTARHPAQHLFAGGFGEGWSDLAIAYTGDRLGFLGGAFEKTWPSWRDGILDAGNTEYLGTRLPIEDIVAYGPSVSVVLRLVLDAPTQAGRDGASTRWDALAKLFREGADTPPPALPGYLWPARFARDMQRTFPGDATTEVLSRWRFPLDVGTRKELDAWTARAQKPTTRAEQWKADGRIPVTTWRALGPIPLPAQRFANLDFDPLDAWNFVERDEYAYGGAKVRWRTDAPVDADGVVKLGDVAGARDPCVFYLRADLPSEAEGPVTLFIGSDDECAVWIDGELVHSFRGERSTNPDDPDRAYAMAAKGGSRVLVQVANYGGPCGFHLSWSRGTPFETSLRTELRVPDANRHLAAVRRFGTMRVPFDLVMPLYDLALSDASPDVRGTAAWFLGGRRNEPRAIEELLAAWTRERSLIAADPIRSAVSELAMKDLADSAAAHRWWREEGRAWREFQCVEAERAYALGSVFGGFYGNNGGCYGGQHVGRCFGGDPAHALSLVLDASKPGPHSLDVRFASAESKRRFDVRLRAGELPVAGRYGVDVPKTESWTDWQWQEIPLGVLRPGRYRVEITNVDGCLDLDTLRLRPTSP